MKTIQLNETRTFNTFNLTTLNWLNEKENKEMYFYPKYNNDPAVIFQAASGYQITKIEYTLDCYPNGRTIYYWFPGEAENSHTITETNPRKKITVPPEVYRQQVGGDQMNSTISIHFRVGTSGTTNVQFNTYVRNPQLEITISANANSQQIVVEPATVNIGEIVSFSLQNALKNVQHSITWAITGGLTYTNTSTGAQGDDPGPYEYIARLDTSSYISQICAKVPNNSKQVSGTITVVTYDSGGNPVSETTTTTFTLRMTETQGKPTVDISNLTKGWISGTPMDIQSKTEYIQNFSTVQITASATAKYSAKIISMVFRTPDRSQTFEFNDEAATSQKTQTSSAFEILTPGTYTIEATITDSRGFTQSAYRTIDVVECSKPAFSVAQIYRTETTNVTTENDEGMFAYVRIQVSRTAISTDFSQVTARVTNLNESSTLDGTSVVSLAAETLGTETTKVFYGWVGMDRNESSTGHLQLDKNYNVEVTVTDDLGLSSTYKTTIQTAIYTIHRQAGGEGVAFGQISTKYGVEVKPEWPFYVHGKEIEKYILEYSHPVGSVILQSDRNFDPNAKWDWTLWAKQIDTRIYTSETNFIYFVMWIRAK